MCKKCIEKIEKQRPGNYVPIEQKHMLIITEVSKDTIKETEVPLIDVLVEHSTNKRESRINIENLVYSGTAVMCLIGFTYLFYKFI